MSLPLNGVIPIALTPFDENGRVDHTSIDRLAAFYQKSGAHGITILGIMGEAHKLSDHERNQVIDAYLGHQNTDFPVIVGCSAPSTAVALERALHAQTMGAHAIMVAPPDKTRDFNLLEKHYQTLARELTIPIVLQDEPVSTGVDLPASFITRLAQEIPQIRYVKVEAPPTPTKTSQILDNSPHLGVFGGLGGLYFFEELKRGAIGVMTGFAYPEILQSVYHAYRKEQETEARSIFYRYLPLIRFEAQLGVGGVGVRKLIFHKRGLLQAPLVRDPAPTLDPRLLDDLDEMLGFLDLLP